MSKDENYYSNLENITIKYVFVFQINKNKRKIIFDVPNRVGNEK